MGVTAVDLVISETYSVRFKYEKFWGLIEYIKMCWVFLKSVSCYLHTVGEGYVILMDQTIVTWIYSELNGCKWSSTRSVHVKSEYTPYHYRHMINLHNILADKRIHCVMLCRSPSYMNLTWKSWKMICLPRKQ